MAKSKPMTIRLDEDVQEMLEFYLTSTDDNKSHAINEMFRYGFTIWMSKLYDDESPD